MLCNVADVPELCNFILPAVHREGPIAVAVSTGGASPALAKRLRDADRRARRPRARRARRGAARAAARGEGALRDLRGAARLLRGARRRSGSRDRLPRRRRPGRSRPDHRPRARARSARCDALVYDVLVAPELVDEAPEDALLISRERRQAGRAERRCSSSSAARASRSCGSRAATRSSSAAAARRRSRSPRPACRSRSCPGVSAMSAVPASAGIPVTHRGVSAQVTLVSGHSAYGDDLDYGHLAATPGTLVVFMGLGASRAASPRA